ncbi:MAG: preprotein translocase subunit SecY [Acutalibacteraceae bacterium]|nr:preprotein translocase subunit SecY [Clostridia bacterium]MEE3449991.1 preprotein translocase subunit SecY [Acutalibacteraceae bacterium]
MFKTISSAWRIPDLRKKILFTLLIIVVFRIGSVIPVPFLDATALRTLMNQYSGENFLAYQNMLSGGAFANATLFAMGVTPYINSSIIMQLLCVAIPALEALSKEGNEGRKKIAAITRYVTVGLGLIQGTAYYVFLRRSAIIVNDWKNGFPGVFSCAVIILAFTAGTAVMMWLGEQINTNGIGNGISILLFAGIISRISVLITSLVQYWQLAVNGQTKFFFFVPIFVVLFLFVIWLITFMNDAERRIPIQYAKRVVGRKMYGGQSSYFPIKVGMGGVLPVIFASSILSIPATINMFAKVETGFWGSFFKFFSTTSVGYMIIYFILIIMFAYFYTTIQYNPVEIANNLRTSNGTIPGIRPGRPTADFIAKILSRITLIGALFLSVIALLPLIFGKISTMGNLSLGGTSIIILVGVALDTVKQLESQIVMRNYKGKGFLD